MIRSFTPRDLESVIQVWRQANRQAHRFLPASFWEQRQNQVAKALLKEEVYVAEDQGAILGFAGLHQNWIHGLFVLPQNQGQGIGRALLRALKERRGQLWLQVYEKNQAALSLYLREGFQICRRGLDPDSDEVKLTLVWRR